jgi:hypothetical protein
MTMIFDANNGITMPDGTVQATKGLPANGSSAGVLNATSATVAGSITFGDGTAMSTGYSLGMRNRIINGAMMIDQRNSGASVTNPTGYVIDRWSVSISQATLTMGQNYGGVTPPAGFSNYLGVKATTAATIGSSDYFGIFQTIEGYNIADLSWGTSNAKTVTLSFWVYSSLTGTFGGVLKNATSGATRSYPFTYSIGSANTWTQISLTIAGDTAGTWNSTNGAGLCVQFGLGVGSTYGGTAGSWAGANYLGVTGETAVVSTLNAVWYVTGVQLEKGTVATPFEYRNYGTELNLAQRYYFKILDPTGRGVATGTTSGGASRLAFWFPTTMRVAPSITWSGAASFWNGSVAQTVASPSPTFWGGYSLNCVDGDFTMTTAYTQGQAVAMYSGVNSSSYLAGSAEL